MKKSKILIALVAVITLVTPMLIHAAIAPGATFTATANCGIYEGAVRVSASNATVTSADNFCDRGKQLRATAIAGSAGTASVSFTVIDATDTNAMTNLLEMLISVVQVLQLLLHQIIMEEVGEVHKYNNLVNHKLHKTNKINRIRKKM